MKMHALSSGRLRMRKNVYLPDADRQETIELPVASYLFRHPQGNVLFDTGCHPSVEGDAGASRWGTMAKSMVPIAGPGNRLLNQLGEVGLIADDIDVVVNSHLHSDHCGCNEFFTRATMFCHMLELEAAQAEGGIQKGYIAADWCSPMPFKTIDAQHDLFGDGRIVLLPMPGHTPGMTAALANLDRDGTFLLASDAVPLQQNLDRRINPRNTWNPELSLQSLDEISRLQASGATVLYGHDDLQWQGMRKGVDAYE